MAISAEEEETIESIKKWWDETGKSIAIGVAIAAVLFLGWQLWQNRTMEQSGAASAAFEELTGLVSGQPAEPISEDNRTQARQLIETLKTEHADTVYALYGALFGARLAVEADDLAAAEQELRWLLDNTTTGMFNQTDESLVLTAQLRLARVLFAQGELQAALDLIAGVDPKGFAADFAELRGDIHMAMGEAEQAQNAWQEAVELDPGSPTLQMKLNNLTIGS